MIGGSLLLAVLTVLLWPIAVLIRKRYQRPLFTAKTDRILYFLSRIVCLGELVFILGPIIAFSEGLEHIVIFGDAINPWLQAFHIFGWFLMAGVTLLVVAAIRFVRLPGQRPLVSYSRKSSGDWWNRVRRVCLAIPFTRCVAEVLIRAGIPMNFAHRGILTCFGMFAVRAPIIAYAPWDTRLSVRSQMSAWQIPQRPRKCTHCWMG